MGGIRISPSHGLNPSLERCFFCNENKGVILFGRLAEDVQAPRTVVINKEPCDKCKDFMLQGIILISVDEKKTGEDRDNPWRTGGWCVVRDEYIEKVIAPGELRDGVLKRRVAFLPDEAWTKLGLPYPEAPA